MKGSKLAVISILCVLLIATIACGGKSGSPTPTPTTKSLPDLVVADMQFAPNHDCWSDSYQCGTNVLVKNIGTANAGPFAVAFNGIQQNVAGLAAGQEKSLLFTSCAFMSNGTATVDAAAQVTESNESNNALTILFLDPPTPTPCTPPASTPIANEVNESNSGSQVDISVGELLIVTLESNPGSTGYSWNLSAISDTNVIQNISYEYIAPEPTEAPVVGQSGHEKWTFQALAAGTTSISMKYIRPWETEPVANFSITVIVK